MGLGNIIEPFIREMNLIREVLERKIKPFGKEGAHITGINPKHIGKTAKVIILDEPEEEKKEEGKSK